MSDTKYTDATGTNNGTVVVSSWLNDVNTIAYPVLGSVVGTDTITATGPSTLASYVAGQILRFLPTGNNVGSSVTINISGLGAKSVLKYGNVALLAGDLVTGVWAHIVYDGTAFQLVNPNIADVAHGGTGATTGSQALINLGATGRLINVQHFTTSGTYTPTAGTTSIIVELVGAGGGGAGSAATAAGQSSVGAGGGGGAYGKTRLTSGFSGAVITIGAGGSAGGIGAVGGTGGTTSFGSFLQATGGIGGGTSGANANAIAGGSAGGTATLGNIVNGAGQPSGIGVGVNAQPYTWGGAGGSSMFGSGGIGPIIVSASGNAAGNPGGGFGGGGSGSATGASQGGAGGAVGQPGFIIVYEYS